MATGPWTIALTGLALVVAGCASPPAAPSPPPPPPTQGQLEVAFVDVGHGVGVVARMPDGSLLLYGCGPAAGSPDDHSLAQHLRAAHGLEEGARLGLVVLPSLDPEHAGGCPDLLEAYYFDQLLGPFPPGTDAPFHALRDQVRRENGTIHSTEARPAPPGPGNASESDGTVADRPVAQGALALSPGAERMGARAHVTWSAAAPAREPRGQQALALRLDFGSTRFCLADAVPSAAESGLEGPCDVLLTGLGPPEDAAWLRAARPAAAVLSFGQNDARLPDAALLCALQEASARLRPTHLLGTVAFRSDGRNVTVVPAMADDRSYCASGARYWTSATPPAPASSAGLRLDATMDPAPCAGTFPAVGVGVRDAEGAAVPGAVVRSRWYFPHASSESAVTNATGEVGFSRLAPPAHVGLPVVVDFQSASSHGAGSTAVMFTPRACA